MTFKKAIDLSGLSSTTKEIIDSTDNNLKDNSRGVAGDNLAEGIPSFVQAPSEKILTNKNNSWIVLGRDRPGNRISGYGGKGNTQAASIDIVVGRMGAEAKTVNKLGEQIWTDPDLKKDAARIYISQKTDVDNNFKLVDGGVGNSKTRSAIALKADAVRIVSREGIKLVTKTDLKNSQGGKVETIRGIDLIAGNNDQDLQPMPKGDNVVEALDKILTQIDKLNGIVDAFVMIQSEYNEALQNHFHYSPYFAAPTTTAFDVVVPKGIKTQINILTKVKRSLVNHKTNIAAIKINYLSPVGTKYINSRWNKTN